MSNTVGSILSDFFSGLIHPLRILVKWFSWVSVTIVGFVYFLIKYTFDGVQLLFDQIQLAPDLIAAGQSAVSSGGALSGFPLFATVINTFIPADLMLAYFSLILQFWIWMLVYRAIKSWIPTLS